MGSPCRAPVTIHIPSARLGCRPFSVLLLRLRYECSVHTLANIPPLFSPQPGRSEKPNLAVHANLSTDRCSHIAVVCMRILYELLQCDVARCQSQHQVLVRLNWWCRSISLDTVRKYPRLLLDAPWAALVAVAFCVLPGASVGVL
jgi:hypothetical protein